MRALRLPSVFLPSLLALAACGEGRVDWNEPENLLLAEEVTDRDGFAELDYVSLIDAPCKPVYDALTAVEEYPQFIQGVDQVQLLQHTQRSKTVQIAQRVIGRQTNAKVEWTFDPERMRIEFKTLSSDLTYNDGYYKLEQSPDGKRCVVRTKFLVKQGKGLSLDALGQATREAFLTAARGVKKRATAPAG